jgi:hypothetical protein
MTGLGVGVDEQVRVQASTTADDAGCGVDWSWLTGLGIEGGNSTLDTLTLRLSTGEALTIQAMLWKGKPFLAFRFPAGREPRSAGDTR